MNNDRMMKQTIKILLAAAILASSGHNLSGSVIVRDTLGCQTSAAGNAVELLSGMIPGVRVSSLDGNPVGAQYLYVRGINSLRTDNQPLWIVDGTMLSTDLNENLDGFWQYGEQSYTAPLNPLAFLNSSEIESIEVVKDVSALARYGSLGANGVVIVKTKLSERKARSIELSSNASLNMAFDKSISHSHRISFNGTKAGSAYNISGTFRNITGTLPRNSSNYGSLKFNFDTKATKTVWFGLNALLSAGSSCSPTGTAWLGAPSYTLSLRDPLLSPYVTKSAWETDYDDNTLDYRGILSTYFTLNFTNWLSLTARGGLDLQDNKRIIWYGMGTDLGRISTTNENGGAGAILTSLLFHYNASLTLDVNKVFAEKHSIKGFVSAEVIGSDNNFNTLNSINFVTHELRGKATGTPVGNSPRNNHIFKRTYSHLGATANLAYNWNRIAGIDLTFRYDYTPSYKGKVSDIYPGADAYLDLKKLLIPSVKALSTLKVEGGYGWSGREKYVPYELFGNYLSANSWKTPDTNTEPFYDGLDRLLTKEYHAGVRIGVLKDRLVFGAAYFDRSTDDTFIMFRNGGGSSTSNWDWIAPVSEFERTSSLRTRGYEFDARASIINSNGWRWTVDANLNYNINRMTSSNAEDFYGKVVGQGIYCTCNAVGTPISSLFGYKTDGNGKYIDVTGEGLISPADKTVIGCTIPKYYGGLQTTVSYKNLALEIRIDGAAGHDIANINNLVKDGFRDSEGNIVLSSTYIEKGDFLRLGNVGLKYSVPSKIKWLKGLDITLTGHNLFYLTRYSGWNPDVNSYGVSTLTNGLDYGSYPAARSIIAGIRLKF